MLYSFVWPQPVSDPSLCSSLVSGTDGALAVMLVGWVGYGLRCW
jgi:hypothetical protein